MVHLYLVMGPTGSGKSTAVNYILKKVPNLERLIQYTTRPKRSEKEVNADYMFVNDDVYDTYMAQSLVLSNRSYNVPSSAKKIWRYGVIMEDIFKRATFDDKLKPTYNGSFIMAANPSQVSDIIGALISQDGVEYINKIQLNIIYVKTDPIVRLKNLYEREKSSTQNYDELLRRYIDDQEKVIPSCEAVYKMAKALNCQHLWHGHMIASAVEVPNDYTEDIFYILDTYIKEYISEEEDK